MNAVTGQIKQMQSMVGKRPTTAGASSPWSPTIARQQAKQAAAAAKAAAAAQQQVLAQAWKRQTAQARVASAQQARVLTQAWNRQQRAHKVHQQTLLNQQKAANSRALAQQTAHQKKMSKLGGLTPLGFAENLQKSKLVNAGKNINWVGRQLTYNFTLPIVTAGAALSKFSLDIERSTTQLSKVYGDIREEPKMLEAEVKALGESFKLLSTYFGVNQVAVIDIAAAWAAAGSAGRGLAENTRATLETMILGDMDAQKATEGLIAIQAQWGFSTKQNAEGVSELTIQLAHLNAIENATGISTDGLVEVIQRAGGTARTSGVEFRELGALAAALVPATGDAAQAGTALRSIISSLMAPTQQAIDALELMGITVTDPSFMGADVVGRLKIVADEFNELSDAQKGVVSSTIATKWQVSRFDVLMRQITDPLSFYNRALEVTGDDTRSLQIRTRELNEVLGSHPKQFEIMTNAMKNAMADAFLPLIPTLMSIVGLITDLVLAFNNLSPGMKQMIIYGLGLLAVLGPLMSLLGSTMQLFGTMQSALKPAGAAIKWLTTAILWPLIKTFGLVAASFVRMTVIMTTRAVVPMIRSLVMMSAAFLRMAATAVASWLTAFLPLWAIVAIIAAIVAAVILILDEDLRQQIWSIIVDIGRAFAQLPRIIGEALAATGRMISRWMADIVEFLSYLNPFARHSPSLVENVRNGVSTILDEYSRLRAIPSMVSSAAAALQAFSNATNAEGQSFREADLRKKANVEGASPGAQAAANNLVTQILQLERSLAPLESAINDQERVVDAWATSLKVADAQIEVMDKHLKTLKIEYDRLGDAIADANQRIGDLAQTPIEGMGALEDQIFANQHAQNLLNMELLEFEKRGLSLDSIADKYARMAGEIEVLQGTQAELRGAGAGSDILSWYDDQIAAIRGQRQEMGEVERTIQDIEDRLNALDLEGRFLELTKAINFDPLERQIDQIANRITEMPFDEIVRQILEQQAIVDQLTPQYEALATQVEREEAAIEAANVGRAAIAEKLDVEQEKLDQLKQAYSDIKDLLGDMESALSGFASAMKEAADEASRLEELFAAGEGMDFEDFGGEAPLGREGFLADIEKFNEEMEALLEEAMRNMGDFDLLTPLKEAWEKAKAWLKSVPDKILEIVKEWWPLIAAGVAVGLVGAFLGTIPMLIVVAGLLAGALIATFWDDIKKWLIDDKMWMVIGAGLVTGIAMALGGWMVALIVGVGLLVGAAIAAYWDDIAANFDALWENVKEWWGKFMANFDALWEDIKNIDSFGTGWDLIKGLANGIWQGFQDVWHEIMGNFDALWEDIKEFFGVSSPSTLFFDLGVDLIQGLINGLTSMMEAIGGWFANLGVAVWQWAYDNIIGKVLNAITSLPEVVGGVFDRMWNTVKTIWESVGSGLQTIFDTVIAPVFGSFLKVFNEVVKPAFEFLRDNIIKPIMDTIYTAIATVWNGISGLVEGGVNFFISAFNKIGDAVNAVASFLRLPDNWRIPDMNPVTLTRLNQTPPRGGTFSNAATATMAAGGVAPVDQRGGAYNMPRAIVGEGSRIYPEYVIPTDPQYRSRALAFWEQAGSHLMAQGGQVPLANAETLYDAVGSWAPPTTPPGGGVGSGGGGGASTSWGGGKNWLESAMSAIANAGKAVVQGAVKAVWMVGKPAAEWAVKQIPNDIFRGAGNGILTAVDSWVNGRSQEWDALAGNFAPTVAAPGGAGDTGSGATAAGIPIHHGSGSWQAFTALLNRMGIPYQNLGTYANRGTKYGTPSMHAQNRAMDFGGTTAQLRQIDHALYDAFKPHLHELIWSGPDARNVYRGQDHAFRSEIANDHRTHVHASMAAGGRFYVPHIPGGVNLNVAEGRSGEQVQILPVDESATGGTTIVINGNLEFPNVKNGSDANDFIQNLRALAN